MKPSLRERLGWGSLAADAGEGDRALMARALAYLFAGGATLGFAALIFLPTDQGANVPANVAILGAGYAAAAAAIAGFDRLPRWAFPLLLAGGTVCTTLGVYFNGRSANDDEMFYLWVALYAFYFFGWRQAALQLAFVGACYAGVLALTEPGGAWFNRWLITLGSLTVAGLMLGLLKRRVQGLIERLGDAARRDPLTGLLNRRGFQEAFAQELARGRRSGAPLSLLVGDLDHFKDVNDQLGHQAGDRALERVASILEAVKRQIDVVARIGGEEFALIAPDTGAEGAHALAERLRDALAAAFAREPVPLTMSFGIATTGLHGHSEQTLLHSADKALYEAKARGRDRSLLAPRPGDLPGGDAPRSLPPGRRAA